MENDRITFVRDGHFYSADKETVEVLKAVQKWDDGAERNAAQDLFERGITNGRIHEGRVPSNEHAHEVTRRVRHLVQGEGHGF